MLCAIVRASYTNSPAWSSAVWDWLFKLWCKLHICKNRLSGCCFVW